MTRRRREKVVRSYAEFRRRQRRGEPKSVGKAYMMWVLGLFFVPGLHRYYLERPRTGSLMLLMVLGAMGLAAIGLAEIYGTFFDMLEPGSAGAAADPTQVVQQARKWFAYAAVAGGAYAVWALVDLFLIPSMARAE